MGEVVWVVEDPDETEPYWTFLREVDDGVTVRLFLYGGEYVLHFFTYCTLVFVQICGSVGSYVVSLSIRDYRDMHIDDFFHDCDSIAKRNFQSSSPHAWSTATHAFRVIRWLALALGVRVITLQDWWYQVYSDGTEVSSEDYGRLFLAFERGHKPETSLEMKFYSEYLEAKRACVVVRVIEDGWYARFGFTKAGRYMRVSPGRMRISE